MSKTIMFNHPSRYLLPELTPLCCLCVRCTPINLSMTDEGKRLNEIQLEMFGKKIMKVMVFKTFMEHTKSLTFGEFEELKNEILIEEMTGKPFESGVA